jgi:hypothetical protein
MFKTVRGHGDSLVSVYRLHESVKRDFNYRLYESVKTYIYRLGGSVKHSVQVILG